MKIINKKVAIVSLMLLVILCHAIYLDKQHYSAIMIAATIWILWGGLFTVILLLYNLIKKRFYLSAIILYVFLFTSGCWWFNASYRNDLSALDMTHSVENINIMMLADDTNHLKNTFAEFLNAPYKNRTPHELLLLLTSEN